MDLNTDDPNDEPTQEEVDANDLIEQMREYSIKFDELALERHQAGAAEYGQFTFLENDVVRMMAEELADTANYCRMQFIKLMLLNNLLVDKIGADKNAAQDAENIGIGIKAFKGVKDIGWGN